MDVADLITRAQDALTVRRVFADPVERDGVTVIPAASVRGGAGGGGGADDAGKGEGSGGGFGLVARPAGAFVVKDGNVTWQPALDLNRVILGGQIVGVIALLVGRSIARAWAHRRRSH